MACASHELHGVSSNEVVCQNDLVATELVARRGTDRAVGPYSPISTVQGLHALEGDELLQPRSCQWPGRHRLVPGW